MRALPIDNGHRQRPRRITMRVPLPLTTLRSVRSSVHGALPNYLRRCARLGCWAIGVGSGAASAPSERYPASAQAGLVASCASKALSSRRGIECERARQQSIEASATTEEWIRDSPALSVLDHLGPARARSIAQVSWLPSVRTVGLVDVAAADAV